MRTLPAAVLRRPLGAVLAAATAAAAGPLLAKMDDDDVYGAEHLWDLVLAHEYSGAALVGKFPATVYLARSDRMYAADLEFTGCRFDGARPAGMAPGSRAGGRTPPGWRSAGGPGRILARLWFRLSSLEVRLEERIRRSATLRRLLRPLRRLRGLPA